MSTTKLAAMLACAVLAAGCTAGAGPLSEVQDAVADLVLPPEQAVQLGERMAGEIEAKQTLHPSDALQQRVARVGQRVLDAAGEVPKAYDFSFKVLDAPDTLNAFALPGGQIYVTSGLMRAADTDAQLASVLAHEVAHVTERHIADRLATSYGTQLLAAAAFGQNPGVIAQLAGSVLQQGFLLKYSREQELQADRVGLRYLTEAGYEGRAALRMFRKLQLGRAGLPLQPPGHERANRTAGGAHRAPRVASGPLGLPAYFPGQRHRARERGLGQPAQQRKHVFVRAVVLGVPQHLVLLRRIAQAAQVLLKLDGIVALHRYFLNGGGNSISAARLIPP